MVSEKLTVKSLPKQAAHVSHASGSKWYWRPEQIVGKRIKAWWPIDKL